MVALLEIARAALMSLLRRLGPWLALAGAVMAGLGAGLGEGRVFNAAVFAIAVGVLVPAFTGTSLRKNLHAGPLGVIAGRNGYGATVAYGFGAALLAVPLGLLFSGVPGLGGAAWHPAGEGVCIVLVASWLGAAAGRLVEGARAVVAVSWLGGALVFAVASGVAVAVDLSPLGTVVAPGLVYAVGQGAALAAALLCTHVLLLVAARIDRRAPALARP